MFQNILCALGFHKWIYNDDNTKRWCECGKCEEYWANVEWCECVDGEPIMEKIHVSQLGRASYGVFKNELEMKDFEINSLKQEVQYLKECCINAGKELGKHSFEWDGKEKNLVIQAKELNEKYKISQKEIEQLKQRTITSTQEYINEHCKYIQFKCIIKEIEELLLECIEKRGYAEKEEDLILRKIDEVLK